MLNKGIGWSADEVATLKRAMDDCISTRDIMESLPGRSFDGVSRMREKLRKLGHRDPSVKAGNRMWAYWEDEVLKELIFKGETYEEIGKSLGRTARSCEARCYFLKISKKDVFRITKLAGGDPIDERNKVPSWFYENNRAFLADLVREYVPRTYCGAFPYKAALAEYKMRCELDVPREGLAKQYYPEPVSYVSSAVY